MKVYVLYSVEKGILGVSLHKEKAVAANKKINMAGDILTYDLGKFEVSTGA